MSSPSKNGTPIGKAGELGIRKVRRPFTMDGHIARTTVPARPLTPSLSDRSASPDNGVHSALPEGFPEVIVPASVCPSGKEFDIEAEQALADEYEQKIEKTKTSLAKFDIGEEKRHANVAAYHEEIDKQLAALRRAKNHLLQKKSQANLNLMCYDSHTAKIEEKTKGYAEKKEQAEFFIRLKKTIPLSKLTDEILVYIFRLVFKENEPIRIQSFEQFREYTLHPILHESSGVAGRAAQVLFGENDFLMEPKAAQKIFCKNMPKLISTWIRRVEFDWPLRGLLMCKHLLSCSNLESLTLKTTLDPLPEADEDDTVEITEWCEEDFRHRKTAFTKQMLAKLPIKCKVTIVDKTTWERSNYEKQIQEACMAAVQELWDERKPGLKKKPKPRRRRATTPASDSADFLDNAPTEPDTEARTNASSIFNQIDTDFPDAEVASEPVQDELEELEDESAELEAHGRENDSSILEQTIDTDLPDAEVESEPVQDTMEVDESD